MLRTTDTRLCKRRRERGKTVDEIHVTARATASRRRSAVCTAASTPPDLDCRAAGTHDHAPDDVPPNHVEAGVARERRDDDEATADHGHGPRLRSDSDQQQGAAKPNQPALRGAAAGASVSPPRACRHGQVRRSGRGAMCGFLHDGYCDEPQGIQPERTAEAGQASIVVDADSSRPFPNDRRRISSDSGTSGRRSRTERRGAGRSRCSATTLRPGGCRLRPLQMAMPVHAGCGRPRARRVDDQSVSSRCGLPNGPGAVVLKTGDQVIGGAGTSVAAVAIKKSRRQADYRARDVNRRSFPSPGRHRRGPAVFGHRSAAACTGPRNARASRTR